MPPKRRIFLDTGVLIAAATGNDEVAQRAFAVLDDPGADFVQHLDLPLLIFWRMSMWTACGLKRGSRGNGSGTAKS